VGLSQQVNVAEGSLIRGVPGRVGAALTKPGRVSTVRWRGFGERDGEEYARNRWCKASLAPTSSNLTDTGWSRCAPAARKVAWSGNSLVGER
jgi:hypothetical protein